jgi:plasmid maintenance system antidote protein VapI
MEQLRQFMQEHNLTQAELARQLECTDELISMILSGKRPLSNNLRWRFGKVYGFDTAERVLGVDPLHYTSLDMTKKYLDGVA